MTTDLPDSWLPIPLLTACDLLRGVTYTKDVVTASADAGLVGVLRANNLQARRFELSELVFVPRHLVAAHQMIRAGDVVVATSSGSVSVVGKAVQARADMDMGFGAFCGLLRPGPPVEPRYFGHFFSSDAYRQAASSMARGVNINNLKREHFDSLNLPLAPLAEQQRIADKLDAILARVDACRARLASVGPLLQRFRQSVLAAATTGGLTEGADGWREVSVSDVASGFNYGSAAKSSRAGSVPVLRMGNIQRGALDWSDLVFTSDEDEIAKYRLVPGDLLFNRTNSPELVGKSAVYRGEREAIYAGYLIRVQCGESVLPEYLHYCLSSPTGRAYCWQVKSDGVSQSNINAKKLAAFRFSLPTYEEQRSIVAKVQRLFAVAGALEKRLRSAQSAAVRTTPALLAKAFRGELVPQDPNDEPADQLLARLRSAGG